MRLTPFAPMFALMFALSPAWADNWITSWGASPDQTGPSMEMATLRQTIRVSAGGSALRLRLSNLFGTAPVTIGPVRVDESSVSFNGMPTVTIPAGESVLSDVVKMEVMPLQELTINMYIPENKGPSTAHGEGMQTTYIIRGKDATGDMTAQATETDDSRSFLTDVDVLSNSDAYTIVAVGDSTTDGIGSTDNHNRRWPDRLAEQLNKNMAVGIVNAGIAGNRLLHDGVEPMIGPSILSRFDRDALSKPGIRSVVLQFGSNDINANDLLKNPMQKATADQVIAGLKTLIQRAHDKGVKICGGTFLPQGGVTKYFKHTPTTEVARQKINQWIRTSMAFDQVADFDRAMRDPVMPDHLRPEFDSGDHLHPNDKGYVTMAAVAQACVM